MASRIIAFFRLFGPRATRTLDQPNAWATVSLWRRFFAMQEEEAQEERREIESILEEIFSAEEIRPIATQRAESQRQQVLQQYYRSILTLRASPPTVEEGPDQPDLRIPVDSQNIPLAQ
mmetsp:Transcript_29899/g.68982  ORF Transcript_29899/g.68982 Transcript_29899/m.68982 type:complete len:119 (+) Transcript_29899:194-550(+)|eukprot:CAMPEP_0116845644 /NCGR_PEP_ID=MMETSP0418-20121206/13386_1 /TAXON_ID=1158023 /ORGANISM="Astrosyne radiata, Strain 13vi08-1A" /LENGTH=118 /DNA_ID=CAMNT_0004476787 /DNA_START=117 /DNA_END=473 /DNA_ORIENTATION=-